MLSLITLAAMAVVLPAGLAKESLASSSETRTRLADAFHGAPVMFIENVGQFTEGALFQVRGAMGAGMWLTEDAIWVTLLEPAAEEPDLSKIQAVQDVDTEPQPRKGVNLKLSFVEANASPQIVPFNRLDTKVSFFLGNDPAKWHADVPVWGSVRYVDLYPGVDLELTSEHGQYIQRLVARAGADLDTVRLRIEGADELEVEDDHLRTTTAVGELAVPLLNVEGAERFGHTASLEVKPFEASGSQPGSFDIFSPFTWSPLLPVSASPQDSPDDLLYSTFLGGSLDDGPYGFAVDQAGAAYVMGTTFSSGFPTTPGAFDPSLGGSQDAFVIKLDTVGTGLVYSTFLGGSDAEWTNGGIAVDGATNAYVTGQTLSWDFPTTSGAFDTSFNGSDVFVAKLDADGTGLLYSTFVASGNGQDIAVDETGHAFVTGIAHAGFPVTSGAFDSSPGGPQDAFVIELDTDGSDLLYGTYLGGSWYEGGAGIAVCGPGAACVTGWTSSTDFPTTPGAFNTSHNGGMYDAFVVRMSPGGTELTYGTFLGGDLPDSGNGIALDEAGSPYVVGSTYSSNFPTMAGGFDSSLGGLLDAFLVKFSADGADLLYSTYLGGSDRDDGDAVVVSTTGSALVAGRTSSPDFPTTSGAFDTSHNGDWDVFLVRMNAAGTSLDYATFLGGSSSDPHCDPSDGSRLGRCSIAVDQAGNAYVAGSTSSADFPTTPAAFDTSYNQGSDAFVAKLAVGGDTTPPAAVSDLFSYPGDQVGQLRLIWTAPGDDGAGGGRAEAYDIRFHTAQIDQSNWDDVVDQIDNEPRPVQPGHTQYMVISGLSTGTPLYFAMKTADDEGNWSELSSVRSWLDIGFRPKADGYKFENGPQKDGADMWGKYPDPPANTDFTMDHMRRMFGDGAVCQVELGSLCLPRPPAVLWNVFVNGRMNGGHCGGMASTSLRFFERQDSHPGAISAYTLEMTHTISTGPENGAVYKPTVRQNIAYYSAKQFIPPLTAHIGLGMLSRPSDVLEQLHSDMLDEATDPPALYVAKSLVQVHVLTPYAISQRKDDVWTVWVYDSNWPGDLVWSETIPRSVVITTSTNTWRYGDYGGDAGDRNLGLVSLSRFAEDPICLWCGVAGRLALSEAPTGQVWLAGEGHLLITDSHGRRVGYVGEQFVNEIPGSYASPGIGGLGIEMEPIYHLPLTDTHTILIDGQTLTQTETVAVAQFGPGYAVQADGVDLGPTSQGQLEVESDGTQLAFTSSTDQEVSLTLALDTESEGMQTEIGGADIGASQVVTLTADPDSDELIFNNAATDGGEYDLEIRRVSTAGEQVFLHAGLVISATDTHYADYSAWDGSGPMTLRIDHGSNGTIDETLQLINQAFQIHLPVVLRND